jgi:hypothetical protein
VRRATVALVLVGLLATACGSGGAGRTKELRRVDASLDRARRTSHSFVYVDHPVNPDDRYVVRGRVEDDLRFEGTLTVDGRRVMTEIISDDSLAVRIHDPKGAAQLIALAAREDPVAAKALSEGKWVLDHTGAPPLIAERTREGTVSVGANPILDAYYLFQYAQESLNGAIGMGRFNPDSVDYNPLDDPWESDSIDELLNEGIARLDLEAPQLPRPNERGSRAALPGSRHFRKMVFYLKGQQLLGMKEQVKLADRPEFRRAGAGRAAKYYIDLLRDAQAGATRDPVRERVMSYEILDRGSDVSVELPLDDTVIATVPLLASVPLFEVPDAVRPVVPAVPPVAAN